MNNPSPAKSERTWQDYGEKGGPKQSVRERENSKPSDMSTTATMGEMANSAVEFYPKGTRVGGGGGRRADGSNAGGDFGVTVTELRELMELRGADALGKIQDSYEDTEGLCQRLQSNTTDGKWAWGRPVAEWVKMEW